MDLNRKRELLCEIAAAAPKLAHKSESELNLLDLLNAFDRVLSARHIDPESPVAIDLYKTMLRLGRMNSKTWETRIQEHLDQDSSSPSLSSASNSKPKAKSRKNSAKEFEFDGSFGHGKEEEEKTRGRTKRKSSDLGLRAPLMNITNKEDKSSGPENQRYAPEEVPQTFPSSGVIELPKLQIANLLRTNVEAGKYKSAALQEEGRRSLQEMLCSSIRSEFMTTQSGPTQATEDKLSLLTHKLELLKHEPAEKEGAEGSGDLIAASYHRRHILSKTWNAWMFHKLAATHKAFLNKVAMSNFSKRNLKKLFSAWEKRTVANTVQRKQTHIALNLSNHHVLQRTLSKFRCAAAKLRDQDKAAQRVQLLRNRALVFEYFEKMRKKCERQRRYEVEKGTALFKYSQKLMKTSFAEIRAFARKSIRIKSLEKKAAEAYRTRLSALGISLFINNSILAKQKDDLEDRVERFKGEVKRRAKEKLFVTKLRNVHTKNKLRFCLNRFHLMTLQSKAFSQLCKYSLLRKSKECQTVTVNEYYAKKIVMKCFGHIKLSVARTNKAFHKVAGDTSYRAKERIMGKWHDWAVARHIKSPPRNENLVFLAHRWIQRTFPDYTLDVIQERSLEDNADQSFDAEDLATEKTTHSLLTISNALQPSCAEYYKSLRRDSAETYANAVLRRSFRGLAELPRKAVAFRRRLGEKAAKKRFTCWMGKALWKRGAKLRLKGYFEKKAKTLKLKILARILALAKKSGKLSERLESATKTSRSKKLKRCFAAWKVLGKRSSDELSKIELTKSQHQTELMLRLLHLWKAKTAKALKKQGCHSIYAKAARKLNCRVHWKIWRRVFAGKVQEHQLEKKADEFCRRKRIETGLAGLEKFVMQCRWKHTAQMTADEKRKLDLARTVLRGLKLVCPQMRSINELIRVSLEKQRAATKSRCLRVLSYYVDYRKKRKLNDAYATEKVVQLRRKTYLHLWTNLNAKITGLRCLEAILPRLQTTLTVQRLRSYGKYYAGLEERADDYRKVISQRKVLRGLHAFLLRDKMLGQAVETVFLKRKAGMLRSAYQSWRKEFSRLNDQYLLFCMMAIKIKNAVMANFWKDWKKYVYIRKARRTALQMRASTLMRQHLTRWCLGIRHIKALRLIVEKVTQERMAKTKRRCFNSLLSRRLKHKRIDGKLKVVSANRKLKIFKAMRETARVLSVQRNAGKKFVEAKTRIYSKALTRGMKALFIASKEAARLNSMAGTQLNRKLLAKSLHAFRNQIIAPVQLQEFHIRRQVRNQHKRNAKSHVFSVWKSRALKPMQRAKSTVLMTRQLQKIMLQLWWNKYRSEVQFFRELDSRVVLGKKLLRKQKIVHALRKMDAAMQGRRLAMHNTEKARKNYAARKLMLAFDSWKLFLLKEFQNRAKILQLRESTQKKLMSRTFGGWTVHHKLCQIKRQLANLALGFQIRHICQPYWETWQTAAKKRTEKRSLKAKADNNYVECLLVKSFVSLKNEAKTQKLKRQNAEKSQLLCDIFRLRRSMAGLKAHTKQLATIRLRNETFCKLAAKIFAARDRADLKSGFCAWKEFSRSLANASSKLRKLSALLNKKIAKAGMRKLENCAKKRTAKLGEVQKAERHYKITVTSRVLMLWKSRAHYEHQTAASINSYHKSQARKTLQIVLAKWREATLIGRHITDIKQRVKKTAVNRMQQKYWIKLKEAYVEAIEEKERSLTAEQHYREMLLVKGFVAAKSDARSKKLDREKVNKADQFFSLLLQKKYLALLQQNAVTAKARTMHRFELSRKITQIDQHNLLDSAFHALYSLHIYRQRLHAGYTVLATKHRPRVLRSFLRRWVAAAHAEGQSRQSGEDKNYELAEQWDEKRLMNRGFTGLKGAASEGVRRMKREKLHAIFSAWKLQSKEKTLLKCYLKQCHIDEKYALTPITTYRYDAPKLNKDPAEGVISGISPATSEDPLSQRLKAGNSMSFFSPLTISDHAGSLAVSAVREPPAPNQ